MTSIAPHIEAFLRDHLSQQRGASGHTCDSYAYSFQALFEFAASRLKVAPSALRLDQLDATLIAAFLRHLEVDRGNSAQTRNVRLAAIRSFFRFLQHREPAALEQIRRVLAIPFKRTDTRLVAHFDRDEVQALLDALDPTTRDGVRDQAMLHLAVCAGLRVSELTGLRIADVGAQSASVHVLGKGRRERALPLWKPAAAALRAWMAVRGDLSTPEVFVNARGDPLSRWGVAYILRRHVLTASQRCASLASKQASPHVLRHTCAMMVLQATHDVRKVSLWLGHANLATTEVYVRADPDQKLEAIESMVPPHLRTGKFRPPDRLIALLKSKM
ncbi:tyrosine-type recombinase/integrase [Cupriavidus sp. UME77]|uniref:tyrosine-type recombinase/integrase n=1 Tax=Cupriavidus sp. UME77 TaxID=1862321 RepID=UPI001600969A|nr:tyrosine-type recombinase/integrase [Cupriavidus sp. UME77]MBB1632468.1 integrase [Cupriavidus sp. UME77]